MKRKVYKLLAFAMAVFMVVGLLPATRIAGTEAKAAANQNFAIEKAEYQNGSSGDYHLKFTTLPTDSSGNLAKSYSIKVSAGKIKLTKAASAGSFVNCVISSTTSNATGVVGTQYSSIQYNTTSTNEAAIIADLESVTFTALGSITLSGIFTTVQSGDIYLDGHIYQLSSDQKTWDNAMLWSLNLTGNTNRYPGYSHYPVAIGSVEENQVLVNFYNQGTKGIWLGAVPVSYATDASTSSVSGSVNVTNGGGTWSVEIMRNTQGDSQYGTIYPKANIDGASGNNGGNYYKWIPGTADEQQGKNLPTGAEYWNNVPLDGGGPIYLGWQGAYWDDLKGGSWGGSGAVPASDGEKVRYACTEWAPPGGASNTSYVKSVTYNTSSNQPKPPTVDVTLTGDHFTGTASVGGNATYTKGKITVDGSTLTPGTVTLTPESGYFFDKSVSTYLATLSSYGITAALVGENITLTFPQGFKIESVNINLTSYIKKTIADVTTTKGNVTHYDTVKGALDGASFGDTITVKLDSAATGSGLLKGLSSLNDGIGNKFSTTEPSGAAVSVTSGMLTGITSGKGDYTSLTGSSVNVGGTSVSTGAGNTVTLDATNKTATPKDANQDVTIGGVTLNSSGTPTYSFDDPYAALVVDGTAKFSSGNLKIDGEKTVSATGGQVTVTKKGDDSANVSAPGSAKATVTGVGTFTGGAVDIVGDKATLSGDSVGLAAAESKLYVPCGDHCEGTTDGEHVIVSKGSATVTVKKDADSGIVTVTVPSGGSVEIDGKLYKNANGGDMVITLCDGTADDPAKDVLTSGSVTLTPDGADGVKEVEVKTGDGTTHVENSGSENISVKSDDTKGTATLPQNGGITIGDEPAEEESDTRVKLGNKDTASVEVEFPVTSEDVGATAPAVKSGNATLEQGSVILPKSGSGTGTVSVGKNDTKIQNTGDKDILVTADQPTPGKTMVEIPEGGEATIGGKRYEGEGTFVIDNETGAVSKLVYAVNGNTFDNLDDAIEAAQDAAAASEDSTITVYGKPTTAEPATVTGEQTFVDYYGRTYTVPAGAEATLTVETEGTITVENGTVTFDPTTRGDDNSHALPEGMEDNSVKVKDGCEEDHTVIPEGPVTFNIDSAEKTGTVTPDDPESAVDIDGVVYQAPAGADAPAYDLDKPFDALPENGTATMPKGSANEVAVSGTEFGGFTVKTDAENTGNTVITKRGDGDEAGQVTVPAGDTVTVNDNKYTAKSGEDGGAKLDLVKDAENSDHAQLVEGEITLPKKDGTPEAHENFVYVAGKEVTNPNEGQDITVKAGGPTADGKPTGTVTVPGKDHFVQIGSEKYTNAGDDPLVIEINDDGNTLTSGTLTLLGNEETNASILVKAGEGENEKNIPVTNKGGEGSDVTVNGSDEAADGKPTVTVPSGGAVEIGEGEAATEYSVPDGEGNTKFVIGEDGKPDITSGAVDLDDDESVGFGSVEIGCKGTDLDGDTKKPVKVEVQEDGSSAKVTVPAGETLTVTDADGNVHTYTNNGSDPLTFTVDEDGNVTVDKLPDNGIELGKGSTITLTGDGAGDNTLTAGDKGATLKPSGEGDTSNPPLLESGSVILPEDKDGTVMVNDPTDSNNEKKLEGNNVEVFAGEEGEPVKPVQVKPRTEDAQVKVQNGTEYIFPDGPSGGAADMEKGTLKYPAKGEISDNKDGPGDGKYVLVPDNSNGSDGKGTLWTDKPAEADEGAVTHVLGEKGAAFDMRVKKEGSTGKDEGDLQEGSLGHYEVTEPDSHFTVDNGTGEVTLEDGGLHMTKTEPHLGETDNPSVTLKGIAEDESGKGLKVSGEEVTVTMTDDDGGADVTVPAGKKVTIGGKEYEAGDKNLTLHVDEDGNVSLKDGTMKLPDGESIPFGNTEITNPDDGNGDITVGVADEEDVTAGYEEGSAKVVVPAAGDSGSNSVVVGKDPDTKTYTNEGSGELELEVTPDGDVKLHGGEVTLPENTPVTAGDTEVQSPTDGTKVEKKDGETFSVTVPKKGEDGNANSVTVTPEGKPGLEYTNPSDTDDMVIEVPVNTENGYPTLTDGSAELDPAAGGNPGEGLNVKTGTNSTPVENTGDGKITVHAKGEGDLENASVDIPSGGSADIGDNSVEASGDEGIKVELTDDGGIKVKPGEDNEVTVNGKTYRPKPESPDAELTVDKNGKVTDGRDDFTVIVDPDAGLVHIEDGETVTVEKDGKKIEVTGGPAWINVENGEVEAVTVKKDEEGNEIEEIDEVVGHFSDAGDGPLQLTIKEDGEPATPETTLTGGTVQVKDAETEILVPAGAGKTDKLTTGSNNTVLTLAEEDENGPATLEQGSVILPQDEPFGENNASVNVENGSGTTTYKGQNVEVRADTAGVKGVDNTEAEAGRDGGTVTVTGSTSPENKHDYFVPSDEGNAAITSGTDNQLDPPAMEKVNGNRAGESGQKYVVVPDPANGTEKNIYVDRNGTNDSNTAMNLDNGAAFDVKPKDKGGETGTVDAPKGDSIGHYAAASDNTKATVNHETGEVTLTEGTLKFSGNGKDSESGAQLLIPGANGENHSIVSDGTHEVTVTAGTALDGGTGADISVPANGSVTINGKTYTAKDGGLELWMDNQGNVYLKDGVVELSDGADILFEHTKFTNPDEPDSDKVTVTAHKGTEGGGDTPATEPYAELEVSSGGSVSVQQGGKDMTYKNAGSDSLTLHSDGEGNVSLQSGSVVLPTDGSLGYTAGSGENTRDFTVESQDGLTVETVDGNKAQVTVPENQTLSVKFEDKSGAEKSGTYTPAESGSITVELTADGPMLAEGKVELEKGNALGAGGALFENTGSGSVVVDASDSSADGKPSVTIPENGSAKVNGVEVKGASMGNEPESMTGTVDESDGSVSFHLGEGEKLTVDGVTYVGGDGGCTITVDKDGNVSVDGSVSRTVTLGEASGDITLKDGESLTILDKNGNTLTTVTDKAGDGKTSTLSVDENGNITMKSGDVTVKGTAKTTDGSASGTPEDNKPKWTYVGDLEITLKNEAGAPITEAGDIKITIKGAGIDGGNLELTAGSGLTLDEEGKVTVKDLPYGPYEIVVENGDISTSTGAVNVNSAKTVQEYTLETVKVSTSFKSDLTDNRPTVDGLSNIVTSSEKAEAAAPSGDEDTGASRVEIEIQLEASTLGQNTSAGGVSSTDADQVKSDMIEKVKELVGETGAEDTVSDWIDVTVTKTVETFEKQSSTDWTSMGSEESSVSTTPNLLTIRFPISSAMQTKLNALMDKNGNPVSIKDAYDYIFIYRQHDGVTARMNRVNAEYGPRATMECYYIEVTEGSEGTAYIVIRARNFSVYAFGVSLDVVPDSTPSSGGVSGGAYEVNVPELKYGGTVTADHDTATSGTRVTLTVTPDADCTVDSVVVTDAQGNVLTVTDNGDGTYSFNMPASDVDVQVIFSANCPKDATCPIDQYTDASPKAWYHDGVHFVLQNGIMKGYGNYIFLPDAGLTRAMVAQMLYNMMDNPAVSGGSTFVDVEPGTWYADAIAWAQREDVVVGYTDTVFGPEDLITREQLVTILYRYEEKFGELKEVPADYVLTFSDAADTSPWAEDAMRWAALTGLVKGYGGSEKLVPGGRASRAESAEIFKRWLAPNLKY